MALECPNVSIKGEGIMGSYGAVLVEEDGWKSKVRPNLGPTD
jgi:hypothetical protein